MRVSLSWLRELVRVDATAHAIARRLAVSALEVDRVIELGAPDTDGNLGHFLVGKVVEAAKHPNADRLQLTQVDVGESEPRQIVCGAWNFTTGATVAVALPGALLPGAEGPLAEAKLRGLVSRGMILSERELELGNDHGGIVVLPDGIEPGTPLADVLPVRDEVLEVTPTRNRVDLLSMVGIAREVALLLDGELIPVEVADPFVDSTESVDVVVADTVRCPRYVGRTFRGVGIGPSPVWLRQRLHASGMRAISNVVDVTNYVMHMYGSPLHAFDRDTLAGGRIVVRRAERDESIRTLDGNKRALTTDDLLITDGERAVALAGIMGGLDSEIGEETRELLLEAANFEPLGILTTSERLGLRTDGSNRWEKGVDPYLAEPAAVLASRLIVDLAGASPVGHVDVHDGLPERPVVRLRPQRTDRILGLEIAENDQRRILERLGFELDERFDVTVPTWRARDVTREVDLIEEIARVVLERVPRTQPLRRQVRGHLTPAQRLRRVIEDVLVGAGLTEAYTWSLVAEDPDPDALKLTDPLGTDQARLRTTLLPGLVAAAQHNLDSGSSPIALFEVARVYLPGEEALPDERWRVGVIVEGGFEAARAVAEVVYDALHLELELGRASHPLLHPGKSGATPAGVVGELHPTALDGLFGVCELDLAALLAPMPERILYQDVITYPALRRDIAVVVDETVEAGEITGLIRAAGSSDLQEAAVFDVYRGDQVGAGRKSVAVRLTFQSPERTLSDDEAAVLVERILATLHDSVGAELRAV